MGLLFLLSALLLWLASPGPGFSFCAWFALVPWLAGCALVRPRKAALFGFLSGLLFYLLLIYWVVIALGTYGHLPWWLCGMALLALSAYMALYLALFCAACSWSMQVMAPVWSAPLIWVALDFVRGFLFTGFPWQDLGYFQYNHPLLIQAADLAGHHGITFLIVLVNTLIYTLLAAWQKNLSWQLKSTMRQAVAALLLMAAAFAYAKHQLAAVERAQFSATRFQAAAIQGNIEQDQKWLPEKQGEAIETYIELSNKAAAARPPELVIWPETAMPFHPPTSPLFPELLARTVFRHHYSLLSGAPYFMQQGHEFELYNSAMLIRPDGSRSLYFKQHLVPFGEYVPLRDILPLPGPVVESVGNFSAGHDALPLVDGRARLGVLICFESIFPELARRETANGANLLVVLTNDAWYGRSSAPIQHLSMAVLRAVENRRSLARAANTGISCFIDPAGRISQATPLFTTCSISGGLALCDRLTFFTSYGYHFPVVCLLLLVPMAIQLKRKRPHGSFSHL